MKRYAAGEVIPEDVLKARSDRKKATYKAWVAANRERKREMDRKYHAAHKGPANEAARKRKLANKPKELRDTDLQTRKRYYGKTGARKLRQKVLSFMGGRCTSPSCLWINEDGTRGCTDVRALQIDHVHGGGHRDRCNRDHGKLYRGILKNGSEGYQLLCANCNWIKRVENDELTTHEKFMATIAWG